MKGVRLSTSVKKALTADISENTKHNSVGLRSG